MRGSKLHYLQTLKTAAPVATLCSYAGPEVQSEPRSVVANLSTFLVPRPHARQSPIKWRRCAVRCWRAAPVTSSLPYTSWSPSARAASLGFTRVRVLSPPGGQM